MAISERVKAEARRTIDGMQKFYEKYGDDIDDAEEREHRVARVESALEGCNGLSQEDKIQKTAENLFELTCAQERNHDAMRREMKILRDDNRAEFAKINSQMAYDFESIRKEFREGLDSIRKQIEDSGMDTSLMVRQESAPSISVPEGGIGAFLRVVSEHPTLCFWAAMFSIFLVFVSGNFDSIAKLWGGH